MEYKIKKNIRLKIIAQDTLFKNRYDFKINIYH